MVRRLEEWGLLPPAERSPTGRRRYTPAHLRALVTLKAVQAGYGWRAGGQIMRLLYQGDLPGALAAVDAHHAALHRRRLETEETLRALQTLARAGTAPAHPEPPRSAVGRDRARPLRIGEAARRLGLRVSALRFWETQGLLGPPRDAASGYRLYDDAQLLRLQIVAVLRRADYRPDAIRAVLAELAGGRPDAALTAIRRRREDLTRASQRCAEATAALWGYVAGAGAAPGAPVAPEASTPPAAPGRAALLPRRDAPSADA
jgi:DNA-binding transcriptional MerR regulator